MARAWALSELCSIARFLRTKSRGARALSGFVSPFWFGSMKHAPRVVAEHQSGAARHGGNATFPPCAPHVPPPVADDPEHGGGWGLGGTPSLGRPPRERRPLFGDVPFTCLYRSASDWAMGAPRPAWRPFWASIMVPRVGVLLCHRCVATRPICTSRLHLPSSSLSVSLCLSPSLFLSLFLLYIIMPPPVISCSLPSSPDGDVHVEMRRG